MLQIKNIVKTYKISKSKRSKKVKALNNVTINFPEKGLVFLLGKSGSGKSTLLNTIGGLDTFDSGEIIIKGKSSKSFSQSDFDSYRNTFIGFIFQEYNVLEEFSVAKNLSLALELQGKKATKEKIDELLSQVDMLPFAKRKPNQLSGGQKQRIAIARALIKNPEIIMADEPTGALDSSTGKQVMTTLKKLSKEKLVIIVSHDREFAEIYGDRIIELKDGEIIKDITKKEIITQSSNSGIEVIDDNIIRLKKGKEISIIDLFKIQKIITKKSKENDIFISLDNKSNEQIKKANFINESGNKEKFLETTLEDLDNKSYNPNELKLIKSKLKFTDSLKIGASSLKNKISKLIITILLSVTAFTMFGTVDSMSDYKRYNTVYNTIKETNQTNFFINKYIKNKDYFDTYPIKKEDSDFLKNKFKDIKIYPIINHKAYRYNSNSFEIKDLNSTNNHNSYYNYINSGQIYLSENELKDFNYNLIAGSLPISDNEICITKYTYESIKNYNKNTINDLESFVSAGYTYCYNYDNNNFEYKIVGVIDTNTDLKSFDDLKQNLDSDNFNMMMKYNYLIDTLLNSPCCFVFVTESVYEKNLSKPSSDNHLISYDNSQCTFYDTYKFKEDYTKNLNLYIYKDQENVQINNINLNDNEILLNTHMIESIIHNYTLDEIKTLLKEKKEIKIKLTSSVEPDKYIDLNLVGFYDEFLYNDQSSETTPTAIISKNIPFESLTKPLITYTALLTKLSNNNNYNKEFIKYCESENNNVKYIIQNQATGILDNYETMIEGSTKIFFYLGLILSVFSSLLLMNFISNSISYKKREIGILRALGARSKDVFGIFFKESTIISLINFSLSFIGTIITTKSLNNSISKTLGYKLSLINVTLRQFIIIFAISMLVAFLSSIIPVTKISRKKPIDAINNR